MKTKKKPKQVVMLLSEQNFTDEKGKPIKGVVNIIGFKGGIVVITKDGLYSTVPLTSTKR